MGKTPLKPSFLKYVKKGGNIPSLMD